MTNDNNKCSEATPESSPLKWMRVKKRWNAKSIRFQWDIFPVSLHSSFYTLEPYCSVCRYYAQYSRSFYTTLFFYGGNAAEVWARSLFAKRSFCFVWLNIQYYSCQVDFIGPLNVYDTNTHASSQRSWKSEKVKCMGYASSVYWPFTLFRNAINNVELWVLFYFFWGFCVSAYRCQWGLFDVYSLGGILLLLFQLLLMLPITGFSNVFCRLMYAKYQIKLWT